MSGDEIVVLIGLGCIFGPLLLMLGIFVLAAVVTVAKAFGIVIRQELRDLWTLIRGENP